MSEGIGLLEWSVQDAEELSEVSRSGRQGKRHEIQRGGQHEQEDSSSQEDL